MYQTLTSLTTTTHSPRLSAASLSQVKQSWVSTVFTTLMSIVQAFGMVLKIRPDVLICNGPGTLRF